jgi:type IX secretion system substrate protein
VTKSVFNPFVLFFVFILSVVSVSGQEFVGPMRWNPVVNHHTQQKNSTARKTSHILTLPFFEDFTGYSPFPDSNKWVDFQVYINNVMGVSPVSRGVATFDDLNMLGTPYDSFNNSNFRYADSLTSQPIDLSNNAPGDSLYLSFFYQPQGNGFYPLFEDSLNLYFKNKYGDYILAWSTPGTTLQPFQQVMLPITDSLYFHNTFQFRFVNIAALYWADAVWNVDYIRMDTARGMNDTGINDIGFSANPSFLLNDYTSMPYRQFLANPTSERAAQYVDSIHSNYSFTQTITTGFSATALNSGSVLQSTVLTPGNNEPAYGTRPQVCPAYTSVIPSPGPDEKVVFENTFFIQSVSPNDPPGNDTIISDNVFDNYLAYDDGSAEKSYFLNLSPSEPGKIAIEYHLNQPDTMRGMAIYFGRQVPFPSYKTFSIYVYSALQGVNGQPFDIAIDSQDFYIPEYADTINHFWIYTFDNPLPLPAGTFYAGTFQPAASGDDSIYFGLDVNRVGANHAWYNVQNAWLPSSFSGAIMMRPLLGQYVSGTGIKEVQQKTQDWQVLPNPARDVIKFELEGDLLPEYRITDIQGRTLITGAVSAGKTVDISGLTPGMYFVSLVSAGIPTPPKKIIKL